MGKTKTKKTSAKPCSINKSLDSLHFLMCKVEELRDHVEAGVVSAAQIKESLNDICDGICDVAGALNKESANV